MRSGLERIVDGTERALSTIAVFLLYALMAYVTIAVAMRYIGSPLAGVPEISGRVLMPPLVFIGIVVAQMRGEHLVVELIDTKHRRTELLTRYHREFWMVVFALSLTIYGWSEAMHSMELRTTGIDSGFPVWIVRFVVPILGVALILFTLHKALKEDAPPNEDIDEEMAAHDVH